MKRGPDKAREAAEALAVQAFTYIAAGGERLGRFLAATGIGPAEIRNATREPEFLLGVLDHIASDERLLTEFAAETGFDPADVGKARAALGGEPWEREIP